MFRHHFYKCSTAIVFTAIVGRCPVAVELAISKQLYQTIIFSTSKEIV